MMTEHPYRKRIADIAYKARVIQWGWLLVPWAASVAFFIAGQDSPGFIVSTILGGLGLMFGVGGSVDAAHGKSFPPRWVLVFLLAFPFGTLTHWAFMGFGS